MPMSNGDLRMGLFMSQVGKKGKVIMGEPLKVTPTRLGPVTINKFV